MSVLLAIVLLALLCAGAMALAWRVVIVTGNSGWTDAFWSFTVGLAGVLAAIGPLEGGAGDPARKWLVALLVAVWSGRLGLHIARRTLNGKDDPRYAELKRGWGVRWKSQLLLFLEIQAGVALVLAIAVMSAANNPAPLGLADSLGVAIALAAIVGESIADAQLSRFARNPANKGKVCDTGLWAWSRHPNYFFEFLYWAALVPIGIGQAWGLVVLAAPVMMFVLLRYVSGVPPLEQHMVRSRGVAFTDYQRRVPAFFPRPPRR